MLDTRYHRTKFQRFVKMYFAAGSRHWGHEGLLLWVQCVCVWGGGGRGGRGGTDHRQQNSSRLGEEESRMKEQQV